MTTIQSPEGLRSRGMRDLLPAEMRAFRRAEDAFRGAAARWGYSELRTPTIEPYRLFTMAGSLTPQMLSRVYSFLDWDGWSGERVVLRPDSTIPVARAAAERRIELPARLSYVQNVFRFHEDETDRETWQFGVEYFDAPPILGDVEVVLVACDALTELGLEPVVRLSHAGIVRAIIDAVAGGDTDRSQELLDLAIAGGLAAVRDEATAIPGLGAFIEVAASAVGERALAANLRALVPVGTPAIDVALAEVERVAEALTSAGQLVELAPSMVGDFEYYVGPIVQFRAGGRECGSGGRYRPYDAASDGESEFGIALDAGVLISLVRVSTRDPLVIAITPDAPKDVPRALEIARELHLSGIAASLGEPGEANALSVRVSEQLQVTGPDGSHRIDSLGDLVGLLVRLK